MVGPVDDCAVTEPDAAIGPAQEVIQSRCILEDCQNAYRSVEALILVVRGKRSGIEGNQQGSTSLGVGHSFYLWLMQPGWGR